MTPSVHPKRRAPGIIYRIVDELWVMMYIVAVALDVHRGRDDGAMDQLPRNHPRVLKAIKRRQRT